MKKIKKTKTGLTVTLGFAAVALLSVGFSAWVVNANSSADTGNVSVQVADINTNSVTITTEMTDITFKFDAPEVDNDGPITSSGGAEDLSFSFWVKLEKTGTESNGAIKLNFKKDPSIEKYLLEKMVKDADEEADGEQKYIEAPFSFDGPIDLIGSDFTKSDADDTKYDKEYAPDIPSINVDWNNELKRYDVEMFFRWGAFTENKNPCLYDGEGEFENARKVLDYLDDNRDALYNQKICLTLSHTYQ